MLLKKLIFEANGSLKFDIINIENSDEDSYEITFGDNEIIDSSEVFEQLAGLFNIAKIRIMSNEKPFEVAISDDGTVLGGSVISRDIPNDEEYDEGIQGIITFSIVTDELFRGAGIASKLIQSIIKQHKRHGIIIRAQVVNPIMEKLLIKFGFEKIHDSGSKYGLIYELR